MSSTIAEHYDATAGAYLEWWAPVLRPTALRVLELVAPAVERVVRSGRAPHVVDVGTGTGSLAVAAARRWPAARITAVDPSRGMLEVARREASRGAPQAASRIAFVHGQAERLPLDAASADVLVSSFVFQRVPHRGRALREAHRVLGPGGLLAYVTWRVGSDDPFAPDEAFYDALDEAGIDDDGPVEEPRSGDVPSAGAAAREARRAGFRRVVARESWLEHPYDRATYLDFLEAYAERDAFLGLTPAQREAVLQGAHRRLERLDDAAFTWRAPVVTLVAVRP